MISKMKQLSICLVIVCGIFFFYNETAYATYEIDCDHPIADLIANDCVDHPTSKKERFGQVIEGKFKIYKYKDLDVNSKTGIDHANGDAYTMIQFDYVTDEGILQKPINVLVDSVKDVFGFVKGIFTRGE